MTTADTGTDLVQVTRRGRSIEVVLNRPEKRNALIGAMYTAMAEAIEQADADRDVRSVLFSGNGTAFTAGNDLQDFVSNPPSADSPVVAFLNALTRTTTPVLAAVHGPAVGVGATMLLHCDYVAASEDTILQFPFVNRALLPEAASSLLLPRVTGYLRAAEILLTGDDVPARRALELGLVSAVVESGQHVQAARAFADRLARQPPAALRQTKQLLRDDAPGVEQRILAEMSLFSERLRSPEFFEAIGAFLEKREPDFDAVAEQQGS